MALAKNGFDIYSSIETSHVKHQTYLTYKDLNNLIHSHQETFKNRPVTGPPLRHIQAV